MCYSPTCKCRNFNSMHRPKVEHLFAQWKRFEDANVDELAEAFYVAFKRATGYHV